MASLVIKQLPTSLHKRLQTEAKKNRRSMTQQALVILEQGLRTPNAVRFPKPLKPLKPIPAGETERIIRAARDAGIGGTE